MPILVDEEGKPTVIRNEGTREETAFHEAGHAVIGRVLGCPPLKSVSIERNEDENSRGYCWHEPWPEDEEDPWGADERHDQVDILILLAGPAAAHRFTGAYNTVGAAGDLHEATLTAQMLPGQSGDRLNHSQVEAEQLVATNWTAIEALARELLIHKVLDGPEAERIIAAVLGA